MHGLTKLVQSTAFDIPEAQSPLELLQDFQYVFAEGIEYKDLAFRF